MKRFYKFLMPLVAIVAMALPLSTKAQCDAGVLSCSVTIQMEDSYGDGWYDEDDNPCSIQVYQGTTLRGTATLTTGSSGTQTIAVCSGDSIRFVWVGDDYYQECSFTILNADGTVIIANADGSDYNNNQTIATAEGNCPTCLAPSAFAISVDATTGMATFTWSDLDASSWELAYGTIGFNPTTATDVLTATDTTYSLDLSTLADGQYQIYLRADCGSGDYSAWVGPLAFNVGVTIMNMATSGSDTLRTCNAIIYDDGGPTGAYSSNISLSTLVIYPADNLHAVKISGTSQTEGSYDYLTIYSGVGTSGEILFCDNTSGDYSVHNIGPFLTTGAFTVVFHSDGSVVENGFQINVECENLPDCTQPETFVLEAIDSGSVSFSWTDNTNTDWTIGYGPHGFTLGSANTLWEDFSDTTGTISGLAPNTVYDFYLMANCGSDSSWTRMLTARTACAPIDTLPYVQNFNSCPTGSSNLFDPCWNIYNTYNASYNYPYVSNGYLYMYLYASSGNISQQYGYAMLPMLSEDLAEVDMEISFDIWKSSSSGYNNGVIVGLFDGGIYDDAHPIDTLAVIVPTATSQAAAETYYVSIINRDLTGKRIGFLYQNQDPAATSAYYYYTYIDNVNLHEAPSCFVPYNFAVNAAQADSVILTWNDTVATSWQVAVGLHGFNPDTVDTPMLASDTVLVLDDLLGGMSYDAYVRADCGDEQSMWIGPIAFTPGSINIGISGSATMNVCGAVIYDDGGANGNYSTSCDYTLTLYPNDNTKRFKFWGSGYTESCCDYLRIYAGATASGTMLASVAGTATIDTVITQGGPITLYFHSDGSVQYTGFELHVVCVDQAACRDIEDVTVEDVSTSSAYVTWRNTVGTTPLPENYIVTVTDTAGAVVNTVTVNNMYAIVGGMQPNSDYTVTVVPACDEANGEPALATFTTAGFGCLQVDTTQAFSDTIGNGTSTSTYLPSYSFYNYGMTQQIFTAAEIGHGGQISQFSFKMSAVSQQRTYEIYMGHTQAATASDFIHPADLTLVYNGGPVTLTANQWTTFNLTNPFNYNGTDNLVIILRDMTGSYVSGNSGYVHSAPSGAARYVYQDSGPYDPFTYSGGTSLSVRNNIILAGAPCAVEATCAAPLVVANVNDATTVTLMWAAGDEETSWTVEHMATTDNGWTTDLPNTTATSYTYENLQPNTEYLFRVYHICGVDTFATVRTVRTACVGISIPFSENFASWGTGSAAPLPSACWFKGSNYSSGYPYVTTGNSMPGDNKSMYFYASGTTFTYLALPKFAAPLDTLLVSGYIKYSTSGYPLQVGVMTNPEDPTTFQPVGGASTVAYEWVPFEVSFAGMPDGYIAFAVGNSGSYAYLYLDNIEVNYYNPCERPTNVNDRNTSLHAATIYWTDTVTNDFVVEYGPAGFEHGQGIVLNVNGTDTVQLTGLSHSTLYDVYVRGLCAGDSSNWSFVHQFSTECGSIDALPFTEDFNSWGVGSNVHAPLCWAYGCDYSTSYPYISSSYNHSGASGGGSMYMYDGYTAGSTNKTWFALPMLDSATAQVNQTEVVFSVYSSTSSYQHPVMVGVNTTPSIGGSVVWIDTVAPTYGEWTEFEVPFDSYTGTGKYIIFATHIAGTYAYSYPYIDDITLEMIPSCRRPDSLKVTAATTTTVDIEWHDRSAAGTWIVEYGPRGFQPGTGTQVIATSNPFTLTGLPVAYQGEYYVKAVCGAGDTSDYSRHPAAFETTQIPATLPYDYDFESATEWANWQTSTNSETNNWYRGTAVADSGSYAMYMSADSGATYIPYSFDAVVNAAAYRDIDFGPVDSSYTISFRARVGGTTTASYDGLMVFLVDPALPTVASTANITSPWGNVNNLYRIATVRLDTTWQTYEASFDTIHGVHRVAFFWFNQNTGASYANIAEAAAVDNIHIDYSTCPRPVALEAVPSTTSALLTWVGSSTGTYEITYRQVGTTTNQIVIANTNSYTLTGLTSPAEYVVWVRKLCGAGDTSLYCDGVRFTTLCSPINLPYVEDFNSVTATNYSTAGSLPFCWEGFSNGTNNAYFPHVTGSGSSYWYSNDNTNALTLTSGDATYGNTKIVALPILNANLSTCMMSFYYRMESTSYGDLEVGYFTGYDLENDFVPVDTMTRTTTITFDSVSFAGIPATAIRLGFRWIHTSSYYSVGIDNITVTGSGSLICEAPVIDTVFAGENDATLQWTGSAASYEVAVMPGAWSEPTTTEPTTNLSYNFTGLTPATQYFVGVRAVCGDNQSEWAVTTVTTAEHPCLAPTNVTASNVTLNGATLSWTPAEAGQTHFEVRVSANADTTYVDANGTTADITGLYHNTEYSVAVRAVCGENNYSDWSAPITFRTATCQPVQNVTMGNITVTTATVNWTANGSSNYELAWGYPGTPRDNCEHQTVNTNSYTISGLEEHTSYVVYVRSVCAEGVFSDWTDGTPFMTERETGIEDVDNARISLYPNPASSTVTLTGIEGAAKVTVVDMNGREVYTQSLSHSATQSLTIDVSQLAQGAYFVRITGERVNAIRKLIVR